MRGMGLAAQSPRGARVAGKFDGPYVSASGGTVADYTDASGVRWRVHEFTSSENFSVTAAGVVEILCVSGGGGGAYNSGGGGGAGGHQRFDIYAPAGGHPIEIAAGGAAGNENSRHGSRGSKSGVLGHFPYAGGGGVGPSLNSPTEIDGASGGGVRLSDFFRPGNGLKYLGNDGGSSVTPESADSANSGGGGGAGGPGQASTSTSSGRGGAGVDISDFLRSSSSAIVSAGGTGASDSETNAAAVAGGAAHDEDGPQNSGGGGGGAGGNGGSGVVYIRYRRP